MDTEAEPPVFMLVVVYTGPLDSSLDRLIEDFLKKKSSSDGYAIRKRARDLVFDYDSETEAAKAAEKLKKAFPYLNIEGIYSSDELEEL